MDLASFLSILYKGMGVGTDEEHVYILDDKKAIVSTGNGPI